MPAWRKQWRFSSFRYPAGISRQATAELAGTRFLRSRVNLLSGFRRSLSSSLNTTIAFVEERSPFLTLMSQIGYNIFFFFLIEEVQPTGNIWGCQDFVGAYHFFSSKSEILTTVSPVPQSCGLLPRLSLSPKSKSRIWFLKLIITCY